MDNNWWSCGKFDHYIILYSIWGLSEFQGLLSQLILPKWQARIILVYASFCGCLTVWARNIRGLTDNSGIELRNKFATLMKRNLGWGIGLGCYGDMPRHMVSDGLIGEHPIVYQLWMYSSPTNDVVQPLFLSQDCHGWASINPEGEQHQVEIWPLGHTTVDGFGDGEWWECGFILSCSNGGKMDVSHVHSVSSNSWHGW